MRRFTILLSVFALFASVSCGSMKKSGGHSKEERIKMDAYAMAQMNCKSELMRLMAQDSTSDIDLQNKSRMLSEEEINMKRYYFKKYNQNDADIQLFNKTKDKVSSELTTCKKLEEYKILQQVKKEAEEEKPE